MSDGRQSGTAPLIRLLAVYFCLTAALLAFVLYKLFQPAPSQRSSDDLAARAAQVTAAPDTGAAAPASGDGRMLETLPGFRIELVYDVPPDEGSWVCITVDDRGRLITSAQAGGLYRLTPSAPGADPSTTRVEPIDTAVGAAQGLLCLDNDLYCVVAGPRADGEGLYRLRDTDGDDVYDEQRLLRRLGNGGEHGPHAVVAGPDGLLYVVAGNHTPVPDAERSVVPRHWGEDHLLPRLWDASGHAVGILAPGGWVCRTDRDGTTWELFAVGFRNPYDIAFDADGELFTFDADMEWDMGAPWYRPTRINHVVSGADFGWRSGTAKWPAHAPDSLPATLDIGPGSPTGVCFGYGSAFPRRYREALFALDWTFGTVYAVHLARDGATYRAEMEPFITGRPFPVADVVVNPSDGAMYFVIGGRGVSSAVYRVRYVGAAATGMPPDAGRRAAASTAAHALRRRLEAMHGRGDTEAIVDSAWPHLGSRDRFVAHAARIAIEHQPPASWLNRALSEPDVRTKLTALLAAARCAGSDVQPDMIAQLESMGWGALGPDERSAWLRCWQLCFIRMGRPAPEVAGRIASRLEALYPADDDLVNRALCDLLVYLDSPVVVARTIGLMERPDREGTQLDEELLSRNDTFGSAILRMASAMPQRQQVHYALALSSAKRGWTPDLRARYFDWFDSAARTHGGHSFAGFLEHIRDNGLEHVPPDERSRYAAAESPPPDGAAAPVGPGRAWTVDELVEAAGPGLTNRDFDNGKRMYEAALCAKCHRFAGTGLMGGPDLTAVATRYTLRELIESIVEPSRVISDQYEQSELLLDDGSVVLGRIVGRDDDSIRVLPSLLNPAAMIEMPRSRVTSQRASGVSPMMPGLLNRMNADEVMDLLAYLLAEGDRRDTAFTPSR